ncbi:hypothetical protein [Bartonella schoenbuchensis]|uniref:hypothetical protein n=1 Tax=Bartonella schoenbuchensis TaxID=165694 RepID=UPI0031456A03
MTLIIRLCKKFTLTVQKLTLQKNGKLLEWQTFKKQENGSFKQARKQVPLTTHKVWQQKRMWNGQTRI